MIIEFDLVKSEKNARERGLSFEMAHEFDWETAVTREDTRGSYPERRYVALGYLGNRLHVVCFTPLEGGARIISFRKANSRENIEYEQENKREKQGNHDR